MTNKKATPAKRFLLPYASKELRHLFSKPTSSLGQELTELFIAADHDTECEQLLLTDTSINELQAHTGILHHYGHCDCSANNVSSNLDEDIKENCSTTATETAVLLPEPTPFPTSTAELRSYYAAITTLECLLTNREHNDAMLIIECENTDNTTKEKEQQQQQFHEPVHRFLLAARSGYFRAMLSVDHLYSESSDTQFKLSASCVPTRALPFIIHFLYTDARVATSDKESTLTLADWTAIWRAADFLDFPALQNYCLHKIVDRLHGLRCLCDTCIPQIPGLLSFSERYDLSMLVHGCVYVLVHGYQRSWVSANFVNRLCDEKREELLQLVLDNVQSNSVIDTLMRCQELNWQLSQREATTGASKSVQWIWQIQSMHDVIRERAVECVAKDFVCWIKTDRKLPELLAGWSADLTNELLNAILALPGNERSKMIFYMDIRKLITAEMKRRLDQENAVNSPVLQSDMVMLTRPFNENANPFMNNNNADNNGGNHSRSPNTSATSDNTVVISEISDINMTALSQFINDCIEYFSRRWPSIVANNGFDWLPIDVIEELADVIGVKKEDLIPATPKKSSSNRSINDRLERVGSESSIMRKITPTTSRSIKNRDATPSVRRTPVRNRTENRTNANTTPATTATTRQPRINGLPQIGDRVCILPTDTNRFGIVRFVGTTHFAQDTWIGVELESAVGRNDGSVNGTRYFTTDVNRGVFVRPANIQIVVQT